MQQQPHETSEEALRAVLAEGLRLLNVALLPCHRGAAEPLFELEWCAMLLGGLDRNLLSVEVFESSSRTSTLLMVTVAPTTRFASEAESVTLTIWPTPRGPDEGSTCTVERETSTGQSITLAPYP